MKNVKKIRNKKIYKKVLKLKIKRIKAVLNLEG